MWLIAGLVAYLLIGNVASVAGLALAGVKLGDLVQGRGLEDLLPYAAVLLAGNALGLALGLGGHAVLAARLDERDFLRLLRLVPPRPRDLLLGLVALIVLLPVVAYVGMLNEQLPLPDVLVEMEATQDMLIEAILGSDMSLWTGLLLAAVTPALFEELFFRGYVQRRAERAFGVVGGIVFAGVVFGLFHLRITQVLPLILVGVFLAYLTWCTGSLWVPIAAHFLNNALMLVVGRIAPDVASDIEVVPVSVVLLGAVLFVAVVGIMHRKRRQ